jgi:hypothetical protein
MTRILAWWAFCCSRSALARRVRMRVMVEELSWWHRQMIAKIRRNLERCQ